MNKSELIKAVAEKTGYTQKDVEKVISATVQAITGAINQDGRFYYPDFGVWKKVARKGSSRPNPQDRSKRVETPARNAVVFKPAPALKELVNG